MERCVFCGWTRKTAYQSIRFFAIPREPGMKRVQWLYALGAAKKDLTHRDRVCSVHFRSGRPVSDPSHEDFVPHLYLNQEPPPEVLQYLEGLAEDKDTSSGSEPVQYKASVNPLNPTTFEFTKASRPSILQRKRKGGSSSQPPQPVTPPLPPKTDRGLSPSPDEVIGENRLSGDRDGKIEPIQFHPLPHHMNRSGSPTRTMQRKPTSQIQMMQTASGEMKRVRLLLLSRPIAEAVGVRQGQLVVIKRRVPLQRSVEGEMQPVHTLNVPLVLQGVPVAEAHEAEHIRGAMQGSRHSGLSEQEIPPALTM